MLLLLAGMSVLLSSGKPAHASSESDQASAIKAGMIVNFIRYTRWPEASFKNAADPILVTLVGADEMEPALETALRGKHIGGRPVEFRRIPWPGPQTSDRDRAEEFRAALRGSHLAIIGSSEEDRLSTHLAMLEGADVLTVSDVPRFAERGGMLGLVQRDRRIGIDANVDAINRTDVRVSSQVLNLARVVRTRGGGR